MRGPCAANQWPDLAVDYICTLTRRSRSLQRRCAWRSFARPSAHLFSLQSKTQQSHLGELSLTLYPEVQAVWRLWQSGLA